MSDDEITLELNINRVVLSDLSLETINQLAEHLFEDSKFNTVVHSEDLNCDSLVDR